MYKSALISAAGAFFMLAFAAAGVNAQMATPLVPSPQSNHGRQDQSSKSGGHNHSAAEHNPACQKIVTECKNAGYIVGEWKEGNGLWKDCFDPIIKGAPAPMKDEKASVKRPAVDQHLVQECKGAISGHHGGGRSSFPSSTAPSR